jgi:outer membrane protein assembly factor BamB
MSSDAPASRRLLVVALLAAALLAGALGWTPTAAAQAEPAWTTYHRDAARSGNDPDASSPVTPSLAWQTVNLGAPIWSQPLVLGSRVYVATVANDVFALDAASGAIVWHANAGPPVPSGALPCGDITPTVGIVGTPVIDPANEVIYAVADVWNAATGEAHHVLKGYHLAGGEEALSTPIDRPGSDPRSVLQRAALNLDRGSVVVGFGGNDGDCGNYQGTVALAPESGGAPLYWHVPIAAPSKTGGAVWGPSGPAVDGEGHIYATTGNPNPPGGKEATSYDYSDSVVKLDGSSLSLIGWFEPPSWREDSNSDTDLGSAGAELLPGGLLFQAGKNGTGYLLDQAGLGPSAAPVYSATVCAGHASFGGDAYAAGVIYLPCTNGVQALAYDQAARTFKALWQGPADAVGPPIVSAGLVWSVATGGSKGGGTKLYGLDPASGVPRYTETLPRGVVDHFASPSAAGGRLFLATGSSVTAYQIAQSPQPLPAPGLVIVSPPTKPAGPVGHPAEVAIVQTSVLVGPSGRVVLKLRCRRQRGSCRGRITLRLAASPLAHASSVVIAAAGFNIEAGRVKAVTLRLTRAGRRLLAARRALRVQATILERGSTGKTEMVRATVTLRPRSGRPRRR